MAGTRTRVAECRWTILTIPYRSSCSIPISLALMVLSITISIFFLFSLQSIKFYLYWLIFLLLIVLPIIYLILPFPTLDPYSLTFSLVYTFFMLLIVFLITFCSTYYLLLEFFNPMDTNQPTLLSYKSFGGFRCMWLMTLLQNSIYVTYSLAIYSYVEGNVRKLVT